MFIGPPLLCLQETFFPAIEFGLFQIRVILIVVKAYARVHAHPVQSDASICAEKTHVHHGAR
ncbi:MAG: hypothetical protein JNN30_19910 [Rhodanobacteraceae bacterium]|nr:hypothetical protein [Rhodanobacteraceae bacterium]